MADVMRIEIVDDDIEEGQCWMFNIPIEGANIGKIGQAVQTLFPTATDVRIYVCDEDTE